MADGDDAVDYVNNPNLENRALSGSWPSAKRVLGARGRRRDPRGPLCCRHRADCLVVHDYQLLSEFVIYSFYVFICDSGQLCNGHFKKCTLGSKEMPIAQPVHLICDLKISVGTVSNFKDCGADFVELLITRNISSM